MCTKLTNFYNETSLFFLTDTYGHQKHLIYYIYIIPFAQNGILPIILGLSPWCNHYLPLPLHTERPQIVYKNTIHRLDKDNTSCG